MTDTVLLLGPIAFQGFEVASGVTFGGAQRLAQHDLPGGGRVIDALGDDQSQITIAGILSGPDATVRARALAALRGEGAVLSMTWDVFFYSVVVQTFQAEFRAAWWIPFRLTCVVLRDEAAGLLGAAEPLAAALGADLGAAVQAAPFGVDLSAAGGALAASDATTRGTAGYTAAGLALGSSRTMLALALRAEDGALDANSIFAAGGPAEGAEAINAASAGAQRLSSLSLASGYVGRAANNLANAST